MERGSEWAWEREEEETFWLTGKVKAEEKVLRRLPVLHLHRLLAAGRGASREREGNLLKVLWPIHPPP